MNRFCICIIVLTPIHTYIYMVGQLHVAISSTRLKHADHSLPVVVCRIKQLRRLWRCGDRSTGHGHLKSEQILHITAPKYTDIKMMAMFTVDLGPCLPRTTLFICERSQTPGQIRVSVLSIIRSDGWQERSGSWTFTAIHFATHPSFSLHTLSAFSWSLTPIWRLIYSLWHQQLFGFIYQTPKPVWRFFGAFTVSTAIRPYRDIERPRAPGATDFFFLDPWSKSQKFTGYVSRLYMNDYSI